MYIDHHIKQVGKVLTCTDSSGKIVVNKYDNKTSRIIFDLDGTIPGKLYFALLNPTTKKYFLTPINNNEIEITSAISVYPGLWSAIIIGADVNYEIIDNNIDQTKLTYISDEFKKIVVRDNFLNELNIEESQSPANLFDFLSEHKVMSYFLSVMRLAMIKLKVPMLIMLNITWMKLRSCLTTLKELLRIRL